jgi:hypothetical protein
MEAEPLTGVTFSNMELLALRSQGLISFPDQRKRTNAVSMATHVCHMHGEQGWYCAVGMEAPCVLSIMPLVSGIFRACCLS